MKKLSFYAVCLLGVVSFSSVVALDLSEWLKGNEQPVMTIEEAKQRITTQEGVESIPKETWKLLLDKEQYHILWNKGTERAFTGDLLEEKRTGTYVSAGCKIPVFSSEHKFKSGTGWPSFWEVLESGNIILKEDRSWGMRRVEVLSKCGEHLGHVFNDGPDPTGLRYCINSRALEFIPSTLAE